MHVYTTELSPVLFFSLHSFLFFDLCLHVEILFMISCQSTQDRKKQKVECDFELWTPTEASVDVREDHWEEMLVYQDHGLEGREVVAQPGSSPPLLNGLFVQPQRTCTLVGCCNYGVSCCFVSFTAESLLTFSILAVWFLHPEISLIKKYIYVSLFGPLWKQSTFHLLLIMSEPLKTRGIMYLWLKY